MTITTANGKPVDGLNQAPFEPIAVIGMAALMPDAKSIDEFWQNIIDAHVSIKQVDKSRWDPDIYWENGAPGNVTEGKTYSSIDSPRYANSRTRVEFIANKSGLPNRQKVSISGSIPLLPTAC